MKKLICFLLVIVALFAFSACGKTGDPPSPETTQDVGTDTPPSSYPEEAQSESPNTSTGENIDVDLTALSSTMVYAEVYNMMSTPEKYLGKCVKMSGAFSVYHDEKTDCNYFACIISDATACCSQGLEFVLNGNPAYPEDYPALNTIITVTGIFNTYEENGYRYCQLINAEMS